MDVENEGLLWEFESDERFENLELAGEVRGYVTLTGA